MKFLHTADWQIGMRAAHAGTAGRQIREERFKAIERVVARAREAGAAFILVAGDTFEHNGVERALVERTGDLLKAFGGPVYIIPGNHDPCVPGSVWEHPVWTGAGLRVLRESAPLAIEGGELFPCPLLQPHSRREPTAWIASESPGHIRIGLAHGTVEGIEQDDPVYPIPRDAPQRHGLDYLALGHWHSHAEYPSGGAVRMAYSGTPEPTRFGERDSGKALLVEIAAPGAPPLITPLATGGLRWLSIARELLAPGELAEVRAQVEGIAQPGSTLLDITLGGLLFATDMPELTRLRELVEARPFVFTRIADAALRPAPNDAEWLERLPEGVVRLAAARLRELAGPGYTGARPEGAFAETAAHALLELYALTSEAAS
jgi:predicted phosphodiesterase